MQSRVEEIRGGLLSDDEAAVESTLREHFVAVPRATPLSYDWCPAPEWSQSDPDADHDTWMRDVGWGLMSLANDAERKLRNWRFARRRKKHPQWPVVVCEGDSWVAHPLLRDIADHLFDEDQHSLNVWSKGAAGDLLVDMERAREQETALCEVDASVLLLSGGGNDLLVHFGEFLVPDGSGDQPARRVTPQVDVRMGQLMCSLRRLLEGVAGVAPGLPVVVHGYDYLRVDEFGQGRFLGDFFDRAGLITLEERRATLRYIVDRYNEHVQAATEGLGHVHYVDVRDTVVDDDDWHDEIHPKGRGFEMIAQRIGAAVRAAVG